MAFKFKYRLIGPADPQYRTFDVADGQDISEGDLVKLVSGEVQKAASGDTILGVATHDAPYTASGPNPESITKVKVLLALDCVFEVPYLGSVKTSLTDGDIGSNFDLEGTSADQIDLDDTANGDVKVVDYDNDDDVALVLVNTQLLNI